MRARIVSGTITLLALAACRDARQPTTPGTPLFTTRLEIAGNARIPPGETAQLKVLSVGSGGVQHDVTSEATWSSSNQAFATVSPSGLVTAKSVGDLIIIARFELFAGSLAVTVIPAGTYRLDGMIREQGLGIPIVSASVEVTGGSASPASTTTRTDGRFTLYGAAADGELRVTKSGYVPIVQRLDLHGDVNMDLQLQAAGPRPDLTGTYRLTVTADGCRAGSLPLAAELSRRTYTAVVRQSGLRVDVDLSGADLVSTMGTVPHFAGTVNAGGATFTLGPGESYYGLIFPDLVERLQDATFLVISGNAWADLSGRTLGGSLTGEMRQTVGGPFGRSVGQCTGTLPFVMVR